jgi:hypothetical protein
MKTKINMWSIRIAVILSLTFIALTFTACPPEPHTHDWGNWVVTTPATATTPGEETRTCNTCGEKVTRPIPPTGSGHTHEYANTWSYDTTQHWHECSCGDKKDVANHSGDPCTVCGYTDPNHTHDYATTWTSDATQHWRECNANDGAKTDVAAHTGDPCTVCGYHDPNALPTLTGTASISGNAVVGQTLTASLTTTNSIDHSANTYQWTRTQGAAAPANINGATNKTYVIVAGDVGYTLGVNVGNTATVGTVSSGRTAVVQEARGDKGPQVVTGLFEGAQVTVRGVNLTAAEWASVPSALTTVINTNYAAATEGGAVQGRYAEVFFRLGFTITVENTNEYENWKTDATGLLLRLRIDKLATWGGIMNAAIKAVNDYTATQARVMPGRDTLRMAQVPMSARAGVSGTRIV